MSVRWWEEAPVAEQRSATQAAAPAGGDAWWADAPVAPPAATALPDALAEYGPDGQLLRATPFDTGTPPVVPQEVPLLGGVPDYSVAFQPEEPAPLMDRLAEMQGRHSRAFRRGAASMLSGPVASLGDLVERTVQAPLRGVMERLYAPDEQAQAQAAAAYADPLGAAGARDEAVAVAREMGAEREADLAAAGGRPELMEMATDPVRAADYLGSMIAESLPAMGATVGTGGLAGPGAGSAVLSALTGANTYADAASEGQAPEQAVAEAVMSAMAEGAFELPGLTGLMTPGRRLAGVGLEGVGEAATQLGQISARDVVRGTETPVQEQLRQALDAGLVGAGAAAPFGIAGAASDAAVPQPTPPTAREIGAEQVQQAVAEQQARDSAAAPPAENALAAAIQQALTGVDTATPPSVQGSRPQPAGVPGETRGEVEEGRQEVRQGAEAEQLQAGGRDASAQEAVQAQVAQAVAQPPAPRAPPVPEVPPDLTLEQARAEYDRAQTDAERAAAAGRIAAVQARETAGEAQAVPAVQADAEGSGAAAGARPEAADADGGQPGPQDGPANVPRLRNTGAVADPYSDTDDPGIRAALGGAARGITVHRSPTDLRPEDRQRLGFSDEDMASVEGVYDPDTGRVHIFDSNLDQSMPADVRRPWVAAHERSGHAGLRGMFAEAEGGNAAGRSAMLTQLERASQNPTIAAIAEAMTRPREDGTSDRPERGPIVFEEAIAELAAAARTGNYDHITERYGVEVPAAARRGVEGYIRRLIDTIRRAFGRAGEAFSDADVYRLIEDAHRYAARGEVRGTSARAEPAPRSFVNNASGESAASVEAIRRMRDEREAGQTRMLIDRDGSVRPLFGVDAVDTFARPGQIIVQRNIGRDEWTVLSQGNDVSPALAQGRINAARDRLSEDVGDDELLVASRTSSSLLRNLTPAEQRKVTDKVAAKIVAHMKRLPSAKETAAIAHAGSAKRGWYRQSAEAISAVFGPDAPRFAALLAAMSPQTSVESNLRNALNTWANWEAAGRPHDREAIIDVMGASVEGSRGRASVLNAWINNSVEALTVDDAGAVMLSGPKVDSFMRNLVGNVEEVTNDAWMASWAAVEQTMFKGRKLASGKDPGKGSGYLAMNARVREAARMLSNLTGEQWTPAEVQETVWSWAKTLYELADSAGEFRTARELVEDRAVTDELLQSTPDFGTLFADPEYAPILEEAGYGEQVQRIRAGADAARQAREESAARRKAEPFDRETQERFEQRSAARLDAVRKQRLEAERVTDVTEVEEDIPFSRRRMVDPYGEDKGSDLAGMPKRIRVGDRGVVEFHGYAPAQEIAAKYAKRHGNPVPQTYAQVDENRARRIADEYERMVHAPADPQVARAYRAMIDETLQQYRDMLKTGLVVEFITGDDPYTNGPRDAILDVVENDHLWVYPTRSGFGSSEEFDPANNPLLEETEFEISGQRALANDIFRAVHDYFGHIANGVGFRADGEENAWREHSAMYSPLARRAMTSETRGQNSWLNYGPHGETNRTAKTEDTVFADQKTGLMPEWVSEDGREDAPVASRGFSAKPRQPDAVSVDAYHYSPRSGLSELDPAFAGTTASGRERRRFGMGRFGEAGGAAARMGFYVREPGAPVPAPERAVVAAGADNVYRVQLDNLYDLEADPRGIVDEAGGNVDLMEEEISAAGFDGFLAPAQAGIDVPTAVVFDVGRKIPVQAVGDELVASRRQTDTPEFKRWFGDSKVVDENGNPLVVYHGTESKGFDVFRGAEGAGWFAENPERAQDYGSRTMLPVYLSLQNPAILDGKDRGTWRQAITANEDNPYEWYIESGFDGIHTDEGGGSWLAFRPEQIKSATANTGAFDPNDPSIIASRRTPQDARQERQQLLGHLATRGFEGANQALQMTAQTGPLARTRDAADAVRIRLQDKMLSVLRIQQAAGGIDQPGITSVTLDDSVNAYRAETLMHGAIRDMIEGAEKKYVIPIQGRLKNAGLSVETFEGYLLARVAEEVNDHVASINPGMQDAGAGITTDQARAVLAGTGPNPYTGKPMTAEELKAAASIAELVDGLRDDALANMVAADQITQDLADELKARYPHYVPLRGRNVDEWMQEAGPGTGRGVSGKRAPIKRRTGRGEGNLPQNILGELVGDFQRSAIARGKAKVARAFLKFALENPIPELYTVEPVDLEWKYSRATGEAYLGVRDSADDLDRSMLVMSEGTPVRIRFEDEALRDAMLNMGPDDFSGVVKILGAVNRWRSKVLTQYNPQFAPVNVTRDAIFGMTALLAEHGPKIAAQAAAGYFQSMAAMYEQNTSRPGDSSKPIGQRTWADWARRATELGMKTGITRADDVKDLQRRMSIGATTVMQLAAKGRPWAASRESVTRALRPVIEVISDFNDATENALRLSAFVALVKSGMSEARAAEYGKNMTINFNRKGTWGPALNAVYLFYNASIQGTHAVVRVMRNPKVVAGLGALGALQALLLRSMMDDEDGDGITPLDTIPDYVRRTSLVIPLGWKTGNPRDYYALPMPYGFNFFTYAGGRLSQWQKLGTRDTDSSVVADLFKSMTEAFSPVPINGDYGSLFGDQIGFAMQLKGNRDDFGSPIANEDPYSAYDVPRALQGRPTTPQVYERISQLLARAGGGDLENRIPPVAYLDVAPEQLEEVVNYFGGGLTSLANKSMRWAEMFNAGLLDDPMKAVSATPIASRFIGSGNESRAIAERYYGERGELERKLDVLQDRLVGADDADIPGIIAQAGAADPDLSGIEAARYKRASKATGRAVGDVKRTSGGNIDLDFSAHSPQQAMRDAEKTVRALGKQINRLRDDEISVQQVVDIGLANGLTLEQIGVPEQFNGEADAPKRIRTRTIRELQDIRAEAQRSALRKINWATAGKDAVQREPMRRQGQSVGVNPGGRATPAPDILKGAKNAPKMVMVGDWSGLPSPAVRKALDGGAQGVFDPMTQTAYVVMGLDPAEAKMTAYHEIAGHYGLQGALGDDYESVLNRARQNPLVRDLADKMHDSAYKDHTSNRLELTEEALSELAAARRTDDYTRVEKRWGISVPDSAKPGLKGMLQRVVQMTRRKLTDLVGEEPEAYDDEQVYSLIEDAWKYVEEEPR